MVDEQETTVTDETRYFFKKFGVGGGAKAPFSPHVAPPLHKIWLRKFILFFFREF